MAAVLSLLVDQPRAPHPLLAPAVDPGSGRQPDHQEGQELARGEQAHLEGIGVELARKSNLTLIGRERGKRFVALAGESRIVFDQDLAYVEEESAKNRRKAAVHDD